MTELSREREVHRYYQTWLESSLGFVNAPKQATPPEGISFSTSSVRTSNDKALIAFAQLGCLRLNAKRGIVALISSDRQYILAEATKTLSLISEIGGSGDEDGLWFGNASLPRGQGMSEDALDPDDHTVTANDGTTCTFPALVVNDVTADERYSSRPYAGKGVSFYCGVPIISKSGHTIGVYNVTDDKPRSGISPKELAFLHDMAQIVMNHLEAVRNDAARFRGETMVLGLSRFIQGKSTMYDVEEGFGDKQVYDDDLGHSDDNLKDKNWQFKGMDITYADPAALKGHQSLASSKNPDVEGRVLRSSIAAPSSDVSKVSHAATDSSTHPEAQTYVRVLEGPALEAREQATVSPALQKLFSRAANVLRESAVADGVLFYDAVSSNFAKGYDAPDYEQASSDSDESLDRSSVGDSSLERSSATDGALSSEEFDNSSVDASSRSFKPGSSSSINTNILSTKGKRCAMLGYSLNVSSGSTATVKTINQAGMTEHMLRRFLRRYPRGKVFYFDVDGQVSASESEGTSALERGRPRAHVPASRSPKFPRKKASRSIIEEVIKIVPGARNVVWLPLWDYSKQRWCAGTFLWSQRPEHLLHAQDDLSYLRTFGNSVMIEVSRLDASLADKAKATFIANISHELRSPLHGILGSIEFLQETVLDSFQSSMTTAAEKCGKTLLDTVEHVLDYAKINSISKKSSKRLANKNSDNRGAIKNPNDTEDHALDDVFDLAIVLEEVVEAVFAGQTFRSSGPKFSGQKSPIAQASDPEGQSHQEIKSNIQRGSSKFSGDVKITLDIDKRDNWWVRTQPGAVRRIVMNILGNSLKYTEKGYVSISLTSPGKEEKKSPRRQVIITVADTGQGMSVDFLQNHAFTAFTQESSFAAGTGLGLSIVRRLVDSLGGRIDVQSKQSIGTTMKISFNIEFVEAPLNLPTNELLTSVVRAKSAGLAACILDPKVSDEDHASATRGENSNKHALNPVEESFKSTVENWFGMKSLQSKSMDDVKADFFVYAEPPPIEYLLHHHGNHGKRTEIPVIIMATNAFESASLNANGIEKLTNLGRIIEVISQPSGPQKLAKAFHRSFQRLDELARRPELHDIEEPVPDVCYQTGLRPPASKDKEENEEPSTTDQSPQTGQKKESKEQNLPTREINLDDGTFKEDVSETSTITSNPATLSSTSKDDIIEAIKSTAEPNQQLLDIMTEKEPEKSPVLLVDDNEINLRLLVAFMKKAKHPFEVARNGLEAVQAYQQAVSDPKKRFKHILMDISMPIMDGIEATGQIRKLEKKEAKNLDRPAVIIALTGLASESTRNDVFQAGGNFFLAKPVKFKELQQLLDP